MFFLKLIANSNTNRQILLLLFLLSFCIRNSFAVVNTENLRQNLDSNGIFNKAEINFGLRSGNVNFNEIGAAYRIDYNSDFIKSFLIGNFNYRDNNDNVIDRNGFLHLRNKFLKNSSINPEFFVQAEFDEFRNLKERYLIGSNLRFGFDLLDSTKYRLKIAFGTGLMYEQEHLEELSSYFSYIWRHNNYLTLDLQLTKTLELRTVTYLQYDIFSVSDFRVLNESVLLFAINNYLQISISIAYRYDNEPAKNTIHYDSMIRNGLRINF